MNRKSGDLPSARHLQPFAGKGEVHSFMIGPGGPGRNANEGLWTPFFL